jgi:ABC-type transporter lipoprotein component MlaA
MPREEAEQLTMTAFQMMLNAKYPPQKGFTRGEYDAVRDDYFKRREARIAAEKAKREPAKA